MVVSAPFRRRSARQGNPIPIGFGKIAWKPPNLQNFVLSSVGKYWLLCSKRTDDEASVA